MLFVALGGLIHLRALDVPRFIIRFNTRKILNGVAEIVGCSAKAKEFFRIIDKADKIGIEGVMKDLTRLPANEFDEDALALTETQIDVVRRFLELRGLDNATTLERLAGLVLETNNETAMAGLEELRVIATLLEDLKIPQEFWQIDLSVARGLDYYTGPVFETVLPDMPELGSVFSGGRFDGLVNRFVPNSNIAGVGASVGIDRMILALQKFNLLPATVSLTQVLVTVFNSELRSDSLQLAQELREAGLNAEIYLGDDTMLRAQIAYAAKQQIPFVVVLGPDEAQKGLVQLKGMGQKTQVLIDRKECASRIKSAL